MRGHSVLVMTFCQGSRRSLEVTEGPMAHRLVLLDAGGKGHGIFAVTAIMAGDSITGVVKDAFRNHVNHSCNPNTRVHFDEHGAISVPSWFQVNDVCRVHLQFLGMLFVSQSFVG